MREVNVPLSYTDELYALRLHISQVREKLLKAVAVSGSPGA